MTFYFSSFFMHVVQAVPHTKYRRAKYKEIWIETDHARICFLSIGEFRKY